METYPAAVATIIRTQIGMWGLAELGARAIGYTDNALFLTIKPLTRIRRVSVTLDPSDTYTIRHTNSKGFDLKEIEGVYCDQLLETLRGLK